MANLNDEFEIQAAPSNYVDLKSITESRFRMLGKSVKGWQYWKTDDENRRKPIRVHTNDEINTDELEFNSLTGETEVPSFFWAFVVWNYDLGRLQIMQLDKKTIQKQMAQYIQDKDYGHPSNYDIIIRKEGQGLKTKYSVVPKPPKAVEPHIQEYFDKATINLNALYSGDDPFKGEPVTDEELENIGKSI